MTEIAHVAAAGDIALQLAKTHERHHFMGRQGGMSGNVFRPWFEELKARVPTE